MPEEKKKREVKLVRGMEVPKMPKHNQYFWKSMLGELPRGPAVAFIGATTLGKTNLMAHLLRDYFKNYYKIFIFSKNIHNDKLWATNFRIKDKYLSSRYSVTKIRSILENQLRIRNRLMRDEGNLKKFQPVLIILDDLLGSAGMMSKHSIGFLEALFTKNRHFNVVLWFSVQYYKSLSKIIRQNILEWVLFTNDSDDDVKEMLKERGGKLCSQFFTHATKEPFKFLFISPHGGRDKRFRKGFWTYLTLEGNPEEMKDSKNATVIENKLILPEITPQKDEKVKRVILNRKKVKRKTELTMHPILGVIRQRRLRIVDQDDSDSDFMESSGGEEEGI